MGGPPRRTSCLVAESPGFAGLRAPSLPGFPVSPLPGQCINWQPWLRALTHRVAPLMRGRPGRRRRRACATGLSPVGPPCTGAEAAWPRGCGVAQCPTTALAGAVPRPCVRGARGRFGGLGPVPGIVSFCFPHPAPGVPRCVWRAVLSGCPLPSLSGTPFHAVCAFRELRPVALLVVPACPLRVCALALPRRPLPPPLGGVACAPCAVPALSAGRAVPRGPCPSACPAPVPCSMLRSFGGVRSGPGSPLPGLALLLRRASEVRRAPSPDCPPTGRAVGVRYPRAVGAGVWVWGPNTVPLACMPCGGCVPREWCGGGPPRGGVACHCCEGRLVSGAVPPPTARPLGQAARVPRRVCSGCGRCGRGDPALFPQRAPLWAGVARCGGGGTASPGGVPSTVVRGV